MIGNKKYNARMDNEARGKRANLSNFNISLLQLQVLIYPHLPHEFLDVGDEYHRPFIFVEGFRDHW